jgi:hypothetical protein
MRRSRLPDPSGGQTLTISKADPKTARLLDPLVNTSMADVCRVLSAPDGSVIHVADAATVATTTSTWTLSLDANAAADPRNGARATTFCTAEYFVVPCVEGSMLARSSFTLQSGRSSPDRISRFANTIKKTVEMSRCNAPV